MSDFHIDPDLEIGTIFEVSGGSLKIALSRNIKELTRSHSGRVYDVGQIGSILKIHLGRRMRWRDLPQRPLGAGTRPAPAGGP